MNKYFYISLLIIGLSFGISACSSDDGVACGNGFCSSGEVCEDGVCVLGLFIDGSEEDNEGCQEDSDCPREKVCTDGDSRPASTCITALNCEVDQDCQTGLQCGNDGHCR